MMLCCPSLSDLTESCASIERSGSARIPEGLVAGHDLEADRKRFHVTDKGITLITPSMLGQYLTHLH